MELLQTKNEDRPIMQPGILADHQIRDLAKNEGMIEPFIESQKRDGMISYGLWI